MLNYTGKALQICQDGFLKYLSKIYIDDRPNSFTGRFSGCGRTMFVMLQGLLGSFLIRIPFAYIVSGVGGASIFHIGLGMPLAIFTQLSLCLSAYFYWERKEEKRVSR